jgi:hypothetical protein
MTGSDAWKWMKAAPAERMSLPAAGVTWGAAEILHAAHVSGIAVAVGGAAIAGLSYGFTHRDGYRKKKGHEAADQRADSGRKAAAALAAAAGWMALAARYGVLAGPWCAMSSGYVAAVLVGYRMLRNHGPVRDAREWRQAKAEWHGRAAQYGINGSHLREYARTWLGESMMLDVRGTGRKASSWERGGDLAETVAEVEQLPVSRVRVTGAGIAGRIRLSIRYSDPWKSPLPHPVLEPVDGLELPVPCTVRQPLQVGYDPEDGSPLELSMWTKTGVAPGAKFIYVLGMKGAGKSALLSCLRERLTAAEDALIWDINVAKAREDFAWAPACDLTAAGSAEKERALRILLCARYTIEWRSAQVRRTGDFTPGRLHPLIVILIDEIDELAKGNDNLAAAIRVELAHISSKGRSEGVALLEAGQRGTAAWMGGADSRSQIDTFVTGLVSRLSELNNAVGAEYAAMLPDMTKYGEGQPGVWAIGAPGVAPSMGRNFKLTEPEDLEWLAASRAAGRPALEPGLVAHLGEHYASLKGQGHVARGPAHEDQAVAAWAGADGDGPHAPVAVLDDTSLEKLDQSMNEALPPDLRARMASLDETIGRARKAGAAGDAIEASLPADVDPAKIAAASRERWDIGAQETGPLPPELNDQLMAMLADGGSSGRKIAEELDISRHTVNIGLNRLRFEGKARVVGKGQVARWMLTAEADAAEAAASESGDGQ